MWISGHVLKKKNYDILSTVHFSSSFPHFSWSLASYQLSIISMVRSSAGEQLALGYHRQTLLTDKITHPCHRISVVFSVRYYVSHDGFDLVIKTMKHELIIQICSRRGKVIRTSIRTCSEKGRNYFLKIFKPKAMSGVLKD